MISNAAVLLLLTLNAAAGGDVRLVELFDRWTEAAQVRTGGSAWRARASKMDSESSAVASLEYELENSGPGEKQKRFAELSMRVDTLESPAVLLRQLNRLVRSARNSQRGRDHLQRLRSALRSEQKRREYLRQMLLSSAPRGR